MLYNGLLHSEEQRFQLTVVAQSLDLITDGASLTCPDSNRYIYVNPAWQRIYGYKAKKVHGKHARILNVRGSVPTIKEIVKATFNTGWNGRIKNRDRDGRQFDVDLRTICLRDEGKIPFGLLSVCSLVSNGKSTKNIEGLSLPVGTLTAREREVFNLIGEGKSTGQIGLRLGISIYTVQTYRNHIKRKLGFSTATALTHDAIQWRNRC